MSRLIFGCGYLGLRVARLWRDAGQSVRVVTRRADRAERLAGEGLQPLVADVSSPQMASELRRQAEDWASPDTLLWAVGYDRSAGVSMEDVYVAGLRRVLDELTEATGRILYVSSTGVYGQDDGSWVDEQSACQPTRAGGRVCLLAEQLLSGHRLADRGVILRLAGIYGPGRLPRSEDLRAGRPLAAPARGFLNLIHVDDAARVVVAADARAPLPSLLLVADDEPVERETYYRYVAELLHAPTPRFVEPPQDDPRAARAGTSKRISNRRIRDLLKVELQYPSYRQGLAAAFANSNS